MSDTLKRLAALGRAVEKGREYEEADDFWTFNGLVVTEKKAADAALAEANADRLALVAALIDVKAERDEWQGRAIASNVKRDELAEENERLKTRIEHLTINCAEYEYTPEDDRCYHGENHERAKAT